MANTYTFDNDDNDGDIGNANNYLDQALLTHGVLPTSNDSVEAFGELYHGTISVFRWQFGTLTSGTITAQYADDMVVEGTLNADDCVSITATGSGIVNATLFSEGNATATNGGQIFADSIVQMRTVGDPVNTTHISVVADSGTVDVSGDIKVGVYAGAPGGVDIVSATGATGLVHADGDIYTLGVGASNGGTVEMDDLFLAGNQSSLVTGGTVTVGGNIEFTAASLNNVGIFQGGFDITEGGKVDVGGTVTFGETAGVWNDVLVKGIGSQLNSDTLTFGGEGRGEIRVQNGATQSWHTVIIGDQDGGQGKLTISNTSGPTPNTDQTTVTVDTSLTLGDDTGSTGTIEVLGKFDKLVAPVEFTVGGAGTGNLNIRAGGTVEAGTMIVGKFDGSDGHVTLGLPAPNQSADLTSLTAVNLQIGGHQNTGSGIVMINPNCLVTVTGDLVVEAHGSLTGDGDLEAARTTVATGGLISVDINFGNGVNTFVNKGTVNSLVHLGGGNDSFDGSGGSAVTVFGDADNDQLVGSSHNDSLNGGAGIDTLTGGLGRDMLTGGADGDFFDFNSIKDSRKGSSADVIVDFARGTDKINLGGIDAKKGGGDNQFKWIGKKDFHDKKGELHYLKKGGMVIVEGDVTGNGKADFQIKVDDVTKLAANDFLL